MVKCPRHGCTSHDTREALLSIHETHVKQREVRTAGQLKLVEKNRIAECANRKYMPGDRVDFLKNTVNPQRTPGVVVEQVMDRQYKVRYGDDQHTKVATQNMVPVISQVTEANPVNMHMDTEDIIEKDTGLTQQLRTGNPSSLREVPGSDQQGADAWQWSDDNEVSNQEYHEQQDDLGNNPEDSSPTVSSPVDIPEVLQSDIYLFIYFNIFIIHVIYYVCILKVLIYSIVHYN